MLVGIYGSAPWHLSRVKYKGLMILIAFDAAQRATGTVGRSVIIAASSCIDNVVSVI
jgi:hypothetical protein